MTCSTCGRENAAHLTFCQECGQRLGQRIAPPTPPIGLSGQDPFPSPAPAHDPSAVASGALAGHASPGPGGPAAERRCAICDTPNAPNLRYCTSCGSTLDPAPAAPPLAPAPVAPVGTPAPPFASPQPAAAAVVPVHVVGRSAPSDGVRACSRCRGAADPGAQFCKFCGQPLAEASSRAAAPVAPPAPVAAPPVAASPAPAAVSPAVAPPAPAAAPPAPSAARPLTNGSALEEAASVAKAPSYGPPPQSSGAAALAAIPTRPSAAPAAPRAAVPSPRGRLVVIAKSGADGPTYPFRDLLDIGRSEGDVVIAEDPYLSPRHVRVVWSDGKLLLRDLASTNGVYLRLAASRDTGGKSGEVSVPLTDKDLILVGQQVLSFEVLKEADSGLGAAEEHGTLLFGSPAAPRYARLCQRTVEGIARDVYYLRKAETVLGRESGDVVFTEDPFLSRRHAAIRLLSRDGSKGGARVATPEPRFALVDLGSSNGTFLRIRNDVEIAPGDHFRVGQQLFRVDFDGALR